jgi:peptidyl-prolyl cis-trans isomerase SurA
MMQTTAKLGAGKAALRGFIGAVIISAMCTTAHAADNPFSAVKYVNGAAITGLELDQRIELLTLLGATGDLREIAIQGLIDDRLRMARAKSLGLTLSQEAITAGMEEFASRGTLTAADFIAAIGERGVAVETFRDFVSAGVIWRDVVRTLYADGLSISPAAVDRALTNLVPSSAQSVTLAEIVLDASGTQRDAALALARNLQIDFIKGRSFSDAARSVSVGATARAGGVLQPQLLSQLPDEVAVLVRELPPEGVSKPIILDDRVVIYQMIEQSSLPVAQEGAVVTDYAEFTLPDSSAATLANLRRAVDSCDDLYTIDSITVQRFAAGAGAIAGDAAGKLALLDAGEMAGGLVRSGAPAGVMLCARGLNPSAQASRDEVVILLRNQRLAALAEIHLSELRSAAQITDP